MKRISLKMLIVCLAVSLLSSSVLVMGSEFTGYKEDFLSGEYKAGDVLTGEGTFENAWEIRSDADGTDWKGKISVIEEEGNKAFNFYGYGHAILSSSFDATNDEAYEVSLTVRGHETNADSPSVIFIRGTNLVPGQAHFSRRHCNYSDGKYLRNEYTYYETDGNTNRLNDPEYKAMVEADGTYEHYTSNYIGGSGLGIMPIRKDGANVLRIYIRINDDRYDGALGVWAHDFPVDFDVFDFFSLKVVDSTSQLSIYAEEKLVCTIDMSEIGKYERATSIYADSEEDTSIYGDPFSEFFKKAVVKDAEGNELVTLNTSMLAVNCYIAVGTRHAGSIDIGDIDIKLADEEPTEENPETYDYNITVYAVIVLICTLPILGKKYTA